MNVTRVMTTLVCTVTILLIATSAWGRDRGDLSPIEQLGKHLFFDKISSPSNQSCGSCHAPSVGWTGAIPGFNLRGGVYQGAVRTRFGNRKPPSNAYVTFAPILEFDGEGFVGGMFWDGRATGERLGNPAADQALGPFLAPVEQNMPSKQSVCEVVAASRYADLFEEVWGPGSLDCSDTGFEAMYDQIGLSIAAYEASTEVSPFSSKFDLYWRDCVGAGNDPSDCGLAEGDKSVLDPSDVLTLQEWDGLIEYGEYCAPCHVSNVPGPDGLPPLFTDFTYDNIGVPRNPGNPFYDMDEEFLDDGTPINPDGDEFVDFGLGDFLRTRPEWEALAPENDGKFKVPTLRNVAKAPSPSFPKAFMHNGVFNTLADVVHFYNTRDVPAEGWPPPEVPQNVNREILEGVPLGDLQLDQEAEDAIVAFLHTLSDGFRLRGRVTPIRPGDGDITSVSAPVRLGPNVPNPFNPETRIRFVMPRRAAVTLSVYDLHGRLVQTLVDGVHDGGEHWIVWRGRDAQGREMPSGIYVYRLNSGGITETNKMVLLK
jgi:cytochrome c peroxidase